MIIIHSTSTSPSFNLAAEEYLFSKRMEDLLFLYVNEPSVIIGSNQVISNEVNLEFCAQNNIQVERRLSGGGAVYHDFGNLNYCFISNKLDGKTSLNSDFLLPIVHILQDFGINTEIGKRKDLWLPGAFKISGTASHISKNRELHHGTLLYDVDIEKLQKSLTVKYKNEKLKGIVSVPSPVKNIKSFLIEKTGKSLEMNDFIEQFIHNSTKLFSSELTYLSEQDNIEIQKIQYSKYQQKEWTFKK